MSAAIVAGVVVAGAGMYASNKAAGDAADAAEAGADSAAASSAANLAFQQEQWDKQMGDLADLESIFGPVRENLSNYYQNMTVEQYQLQGKEALEQQYDRSTKQLDAVFSNNGMYGSGQNVNAQVALELGRETAMAANQQNATDQYNSQQMNWLNSGINEMNSARGLASNTQSAIGTSFTNQANLAMSAGMNQANLGMQVAQGYGEFASGIVGATAYNANTFGGQTSLSSTPTTSAANGTTNYDSLNGLTVDW